MKLLHVPVLAFLIILVSACSGGGFEKHIKDGNLEEIASMINGGIDLDEQDKEGHTMLYYAILYDRPAIAELLCDHRASVSADASAGDLALCSILAFWCRRDRDQIDRLFQKQAVRIALIHRQPATTHGAQ